MGLPLQASVHPRDIEGACHKARRRSIDLPHQQHAARILVDRFIEECEETKPEAGKKSFPNAFGVELGDLLVVGGQEKLRDYQSACGLRSQDSPTRERHQEEIGL